MDRDSGTHSHNTNKSTEIETEIETAASLPPQYRSIARSITTNPTLTATPPSMSPLSSSPPPPPSLKALDEAVKRVLQNNFDADSKTCILTLLKILDNVLQQPHNPKVRTLRTQNQAIRSRIVDRQGHHVLLACGFVFVLETEPGGIGMGVGIGTQQQQQQPEEKLVLHEDREDTELLVKARHTLARIAVLELGARAETMPKFHPPPPRARMASSSSSSGGPPPSGGFDVYKGNRFDGQSASVGTNLGPPANWKSKTEQELAELKRREEKLQRELLAGRGKNKNSKSNNNPVSFSCPLTFSCDPSIIRTSFPCCEENPVRRTKHTQPLSGGLGITGVNDLVSPTCDSSSAAPLHCNIFVPAYATFILFFPFMLRCSPSSISDRPSFICGTDSPVRLASLTTVEPRSKSKSAGIKSPPSSSTFFDTTFFFLSPSAPLLLLDAKWGLTRVKLMISPGNSSVVSTLVQDPRRYTKTRRGWLPIPRSADKLLMRENTTVASNVNTMKRVKKLYCQYSSNIQRMTQKI
mmetsp:Transcript_3497/g.9802  ORF Transcript_3497/g.9802 Transcript_3497/m.9802 type:complete len:523 (+) Transcript_3497:309-1877(+)